MHPVSALAPLDYRYALDAAMPVLAAESEPLVLCNAPALLGEVRQRIPCSARAPHAESALWIEPLTGSWRTDLETLTRVLPVGGSLVVIASRPMARLFPECRRWQGRAVGLHPGGVSWLERALRGSGFAVTESHGIHSAVAIGLSVLGRAWELLGRPDLGDRLHFMARRHYCVQGLLAPISTVALLIAIQEGE